jgi:hypothetical protein
MKALVLGCGRSGGSMVTEIVASSTMAKPLSGIDDFKVFKKNPNRKLPEGYIAKSPDTIHYKYKELRQLFLNESELLGIWSIRHPYDIALSKIYRGQLKTSGGDQDRRVAPDATPDGCLNNINKMVDIYLSAKKEFPDRIHLIKMEDIIINFEYTVRMLCKYLRIDYEDKMKTFYTRMRNPFKKQRYNKIDCHELDKWKNWKTLYNGYFVKNNIDIVSLFMNLEEPTKVFKYELFRI